MAKAADMLAGFSKKAGTAKPAPKAKKARPELPMTPEIDVLAKQYIPAKQLSDHFLAHQENVKSQLNQATFAQYVKTMFMVKSQPENPKIVIKHDGKVDMESMFVVQARFKVQIPNPAEPAESVIELLTQIGLPLKKATALVEAEVDFDSLTTIRPFNELVKGTYSGSDFNPASDAEQAVAVKLMTFLQWDGEGDAPEHLTDEDRELVIRTQAQCKVRAGFMNRVCSYCDSEEQLSAVFQVFTPVPVNRGAKFGVSDSLEKRTERLVAEAGKILSAIGGNQDDE